MRLSALRTRVIGGRPWREPALVGAPIEARVGPLQQRGLDDPFRPCRWYAAYSAGSGSAPPVVRVLTRSLRRIGARVRERTRSVARVFEIAQRSRTAGSRVRPAVRERSKARMKARPTFKGQKG
jgi:hypothetical protein